MTKINIKQLFDYDTWTFTYLLWTDEDSKAVIIDPVIEQIDRDLELIVRRSVLIISRLSKVLNEMEDKFTNTSETVEYLTERFEEREKDYIKAIKILKQRCEFLGEDKLFKRRPN